MVERSLHEMVNDGKKIGNVYSPWTYGIAEIRITLEHGVKLPVGDYVFVKDEEDGNPIVYQVSYPHYYKPGFDFEEALITTGRPLKRRGGDRYRCIGVLQGKLVEVKGEDGSKVVDIRPPKYPIPPMADVYRCPPDMVELVTKPQDKWRIKLGKNPETGLDVYVSLRPLVRQSLLVSGAQGTGKTCALLTMIARAAMADPSPHFLILDWSGEYVSLEKVDELEGKVSIIPWCKLAYGSLYEKPEFAAPIFKGDPRVTEAVAKAIDAGIIWCKRRKCYPSKANVIEGIKQMRGRRFQETINTAVEVVGSCESDLIEAEPGVDRCISRERLIEAIKRYTIVIVDFSKTEDEAMPDTFEFKRAIGAYLAEVIWEEARINKGFGCIIVSDEAHRLCPEFEKFEPIWHRLATEGGRNCCPFWLVARRLSIVSKKVTTEAQQNFICFNVEDVDRRRVEEDLGTSFAGLLGSLARGEAMVKSMGFRIPGQVIHVKFDKVVEPASAIHGPEERFRAMAERTTFRRL